MKYLDKGERLDSRLSGDEQRVAPLLKAMLANRRVFGPADSDPPRVTEAIRFEQFPQDQINPMESTPSESPASDIFALYKDRDNFDTPLRYQVESWRTITNRLKEVNKNNVTRGVLTTAPTGFGKTEAFMGPIIDQLSRGNSQTDTAVFVYPRQALLKDQFQRVLRLMHRIKQLGGRRSVPNCGVYYGDIPFYKDDVAESEKLYNNYSNVFKLTRSWITDEEDNAVPFFLNPNQKSNYLNVPDSEISFSSGEVSLNRSSIVYSPPNIILTTLSSLENFCLKVNYNILRSIDAIVFDEIHLYSGMYGSHAANVIRNINRLKRRDNDSVLLIGSSATLGSPGRFADKMFELSRDRLDIIEPPNDDFVPKSEVNAYENYYFMLSSDDVALGSTFTQQSMLLGHTLLNPDSDDGGRKMLSFIDSVGGVNQKFAQFRDADKRKQYWKHHLDTPEEDWYETAEDMDCQFINRPLEVDVDHSNVELSTTDIEHADFLISTSSLEVGIDIGDLDVITQYHTPHDLSSFVQRSGRAGRTGDSSHIVTFLGADEGDKNHFHRADRFLDSDVTTPLRPDNPIVQWIHDSLYKYYLVSDKLDNPSTPGREFLKQYFTQPATKFTSDGDDLTGDCIYPQFYAFLSDPGSVITEITESPPANLFSGRAIDSLKSDVNRYQSNVVSELEPLANVLGQNARSLIQQTDPQTEVITNLQDSGQKALKELQHRLEILQEEYGTKNINRDVMEETRHQDLFEAGIDEEMVVKKVSQRLRGAIQQLGQDDDSDISEDFRRILKILQAFDTVAGGAGDRYGESGSGKSFGYGAEELNDFQRLYNTYRKGPADRISELHANWRRAYYLREALGQLDEYISTPGESYESVYAIKYLLRSLYYFDRYLSMEGKGEKADVWYVPENYFGDAGTTFTRTTIDSSGEPQGNEEPLYKLATQYYPYRGEFANSGSDIHIFQPHTELEDQRLYFDLQEADQISGQRVATGVIEPDSISVDRVADCSGGSARGILPFCPRCLEILDGPGDECNRHGEREFATFYATPRIRTNRRNSENVNDVSENLDLSDFEMVVSIEAVDIELRKWKYIPDSGYLPKEEENQPDKPETIRFRENRHLGFNLDTRGLIWDFGDYLQKLIQDDELQARVNRHHVEFSFEEVCLHSAAHFLVVLTADVCGVDVSSLLYDYSVDEAEVTVFERSEGGQGIVDLFAKELRGNPSMVLDSIYRVGYDVEAILEKLWSDDGFRDRVIESLEEDFNEETAQEAISTATSWETPDSVVTNRVVEEVVASVSRIRDIADKCREEGHSVGIEDIVTLRGEIASRVLQNEQDSIQNLDVPKGVTESVQNTLVNENVDGCHSTLNIQTCTQEDPTTDQSELLSYAVIQELRDQIVKLGSMESVGDHISETNVLPAKISDNAINSISF